QQMIEAIHELWNIVEAIGNHCDQATLVAQLGGLMDRSICVRLLLGNNSGDKAENLLQLMRFRPRWKTGDHLAREKRDSGGVMLTNCQVRQGRGQRRGV